MYSRCDQLQAGPSKPKATLSIHIGFDHHELKHMGTKRPPSSVLSYVKNLLGWLIIKQNSLNTEAVFVLLAEIFWRTTFLAVLFWYFFYNSNIQYKLQTKTAYPNRIPLMRTALKPLMNPQPNAIYKAQLPTSSRVPLTIQIQIQREYVTNQICFFLLRLMLCHSRDSQITEEWAVTHRAKAHAKEVGNWAL